MANYPIERKVNRTSFPYTSYNLVKVGVSNTVFLSLRPYKYAVAEFLITPIRTFTEPKIYSCTNHYKF